MKTLPLLSKKKSLITLLVIVCSSSCEKVNTEYVEEPNKPSELQTLTSENILEWNAFPAYPAIAKGETVQFIISANLTSDPNKEVDITDKVVWILSNDNVLEVFGATSEAKFSGRNEGETILFATIAGDESKKLEIPITVGPKVLRSLKLNPDTAIIPIGTVFEYELFGVYGDGSPLTIDNEADVVSSDEEILKASMQNGKLKLEALTTGDVALTVTVPSGEVLTLNLTVSGVDFYDIGFSPDDKLLPTGAEFDVSLTGYKSDDTTETIPNSYTVTSSNPSVLNFIDGKLIATLPGSAEIEVTYKNIKRKWNYVVSNVNALERIEITSYDDYEGFPSLPDGLQVKVIATGYLSNDVSMDLTNFVTWSKEDGDSTPSVSNDADEPYAIASVSGSGDSKLTASYVGITGVLSIKAIPAVSTGIEVSPESIIRNVGETGDQFTAKIVYSDGTKTEITQDTSWSISDFTGSISPTIGDTNGVNKGEILTNPSSGTATVKATYILDGVITISTAQFISESIDSAIKIVINGDDVFPADTTNINVAKGLTQNLAVQLDPSNTNVTGTAIVSLNYADVGYKGYLDYGNASATNIPFVSAEEGTITVTATYDGFAVTKDITVMPPTIADDGLSCTSTSSKVTSGLTSSINCSVDLTDGSSLDAAALDAHATMRITWDNPEAGDVLYPGSGSLNTLNSPSPNFTAANAGYVKTTVTLDDQGRQETYQIDFDVAANCTGTGAMLYGGNADSDNLYCFYLSSLDDSCDNVCASNSGVNDVTKIYGDNQSKCTALRTALYIDLNDRLNDPDYDDSDVATDAGSDPTDLGCTVNEAPDDFDPSITLYFFPDVSGETASSGSQAQLRRYCACNN